MEKATDGSTKVTRSRRWRAGLALLALASAAACAGDQAIELRLASGPEGSIYDQVGDQLEDLLDDAFPGFPDGERIVLRNVLSQGPLENVRLIMEDKARLGIAEEGIELKDMPAKASSPFGVGMAAEEPPEVRALARLFASSLKIVARRDALAQAGKGAVWPETLGDLRQIVEARRQRHEPPLHVFVGQDGSGSDTLAKLVLEQYGLVTNDENGRRERFDLQETGDHWDVERVRKGLDDGEIQIAFLLAPFGSQSMRTIAQTGRYMLLSVDRADGIHRSHPFLDVTTIPPGSYPSSGLFPDRPVTTLLVDVVLIGSSRLSDFQAYRIVHRLFLHSHELGSAFPFMIPLTKEDQVSQRFYYPPHPGALAFFQGGREPHKALDFLQRYRDVLIALFSAGGTVWAIFHFVVARWRRRPLVQALHRDADLGTVLDVEHEASRLFARGKIDKEVYESIKEYTRVRLEAHRRAQSSQS